MPKSKKICAATSKAQVKDTLDRCPVCMVVMDFYPTGCYTGYLKCPECGKVIELGEDEE